MRVSAIRFSGVFNATAFNRDKGGSSFVFENRTYIATGGDAKTLRTIYRDWEQMVQHFKTLPDTAETLDQIEETVALKTAIYHPTFKVLADKAKPRHQGSWRQMKDGPRALYDWSV